MLAISIIHQYDVTVGAVGAHGAGEARGGRGAHARGEGRVAVQQLVAAGAHQHYVVAGV